MRIPARLMILASGPAKRGTSKGLEVWRRLADGAVQPVNTIGQTPRSKGIPSTSWGFQPVVA